MNIKELREAIPDLPDDMKVLLPGGRDHGYILPCDAVSITVGKQAGRGGRYVEWYGPEHASPGETPIEALVIVE